MHFSIAVILSMVAASAIASQDDRSQDKICPNLNTQDRGCIRYTRGYDVTGVLTTVELPQIRNACDCIQACLDRPDTCASYVWKFNEPTSDRRTCTLYSNFNLPSGVDVLYNPTEVPGVNQGLNPISENPQIGGRVPRATKRNGTEIDREAVSGPVWQLEGGQVQC
ncbi:hypothetical protein BDV59DRAFT_210343 [Aspergillus ambiguus]|uniref:uncharacterized protein n=1 Tax=Aspergillus ambiguus TaxID=176160 RepID=UPI003CCD603F